MKSPPPLTPRILRRLRAAVRMQFLLADLADLIKQTKQTKKQKSK